MMIQRKKGSKYKNTKTVINGLKFDSKKEANRYTELLKKYENNEIYDLKLQVPFELQPAFYNQENKLIRAIVYKADFVYKDLDGNTIIEDVKASKYFVTDVYKIKKKMFEYKFKAIIHEIY